MKITIFLSQKEYNALVDTAIENLRSVPDQAHFFIQQGLNKLGALAEDGGTKVIVEDGKNG